MDEQSTTIANVCNSQDARRKVYAPVFVAVAASLAAVVMFNPVGGPGEGLLSKAAAQQPRTGTDGDDSGGRVSAAEQRKDMISQLRAMNARMERMEALMSRGLTVRVSEMPQIRFPTDGK